MFGRIAWPDAYVATGYVQTLKLFLVGTRSIMGRDKMLNTDFNWWE